MFPQKIFAFRGPSQEVMPLAQKIARTMKTLVEPTTLTEKRVLSQKNFWRYPFIRESDFVKEVESGDVLLFRSKDRMSMTQRMVTGAQYDHACLLLRTQRNEVLLLEATGLHGVSAFPWPNFKAWGWHLCYDRLVYRKVYFPRTPTAMMKLQDFVCAVLGRRYGLTPKKLFSRLESTEFDAQGNEVREPGSGLCPEQVEASPSFFCSELVAACLKRCGVLATNRAAAQYWPGSFSQHSPEPLPLHDHVRLGEEQVIMFDT